MFLLLKVLIIMLTACVAKAEEPDLQTLVEQQAATIQNLQAQLSGLSNRVASLETENQQDHQKQVAFHVRFSGSYNDPLDVGQHAVVTFDHAVTNLGNGYNTATGLFTAPYAGSYLFLLGATHIPDQSHSSHLGIVKTGHQTLAETFGNYQGLQSDSNTRDVVQAAVHLKAGEQVWVEHIFGGTAFRQSAYTTFTGVLVQAD